MTLFLCLSLGGMLYLQSERTEDLSGGDEDARISIGVVGTATSGYLDTAFSMLTRASCTGADLQPLSCSSPSGSSQ